MVVDAGDQLRVAPDVVALLALGEPAAHHDVVRLREIDSRVALHQSTQRNRGEIVGADISQRPLDGTPDRRADGVNDDRFRHGILLDGVAAVNRSRDGGHRNPVAVAREGRTRRVSAAAWAFLACLTPSGPSSRSRPRKGSDRPEREGRTVHTTRFRPAAYSARNAATALWVCPGRSICGTCPQSSST